MKISNSGVFPVVHSVCTTLSKKYAFGPYEPDDIYQEAVLICEEIIDKYDGQRPLENFLRTSLKNRLYNFRRDNSTIYKFVCPTCSNKDSANCNDCLRNRLIYEVKKNIDCPINIDEINDEQLNYEHVSSETEHNEMIKLINIHLPIDMRADYLKIINDVYVSKTRREEIINRIRDILTQHDFIDEDGDIDA